MHDTETIAQGCRQQTGAGGGTNQGEGWQVELDRARRRAFADHDVDLVVLHRRIQHFLHGRLHAVDFVDEQDIVGLQIGQQGRQIAGLFDHRPRGLAQVHAQFVGNHVRECGLAQPGRAEDQDVIECFAASLGGLDIDAQLLAHSFLAQVFIQGAWADMGLGSGILEGGPGGNDAILIHPLIVAENVVQRPGITSVPPSGPCG